MFRSLPLTSISQLFASRRRRPLASPRHLGTESLESRAMLTATFDDASGALLIEGTPKADTIEIRAGSTPGTVSLRGVTGVAKNAQFSGVNTIIINTFGGNDKVSIKGDLRNVAGTVIGVTVDLGIGNDRIDASSGADSINAGDGNDVVRCRGGDDSVNAGAGKDVVRGDDGNDDISGDSGKDHLSGDRGSDDVAGGDDDDRIDGGDDDDFLFGDRGRDQVNGGRGNDDIFGGDDRDDLLGDDGDDDIDGEAGDDRIRGGRGNDDGLDDDGDGLDDDSAEDDDNGDDDGDDHGGDHDGDHDDDLGTTFSFVDGSANLVGTSQGRRDKIIRSFVASASGRVDVTIRQVGGRWIDLEVEQANSSVENLLELEPGDDDGGAPSGFFNVTAGATYIVQMHSPDFLSSDFDVLLTLT